MDSLPTEIVHHICSFLDLGSVRQFRLVCKGFSTIGAQYLCVGVRYSAWDPIQKLMTLSSRPHIARGVRKIRYSQLPAFLSRLLAGNFFARLANPPMPQIGHDPHPSSFLGYEYNYLYFLHLLPRFPRLRLIVLDITEPISDFVRERPVGFYFENLPIVTPASQPLRMLLQALADRGSSLDGLAVNFLDWGFFDSSDAELMPLFKPIINLKYLELVFSNIYQPWSLHQGRVIRRCDEILKAGAIRERLAIFTELRTLNLDFARFFNNHEPHSSGTSLGNIIPQGFTWSYLHSLRLCRIFTDIKQGQQCWDTWYWTQDVWTRTNRYFVRDEKASNMDVCPLQEIAYTEA
ncbi:hypothetical protein F4813DRAFT_361394 [Daldinia decipiens]|uniref:uncharacterized protein n=1 Tax=Daldinia decipiens TaxID=326647 RepID=UPI0020C3D071|nr:uncharacterized protein F4813DRAFT_361394 [Daldinia decipiens]KAI1657044.1 hypothetical protein F4813DRAFT_361394 [Daldinia decipiens]